MSWDDEPSVDAEKARKRQEMLTTIDKALATFVLSGISISNLMGWTHVTPDTAANINTVLALAAPILVWIIPNKAK